jgi:hypothetical protein
MLPSRAAVSMIKITQIFSSDDDKPCNDDANVPTTTATATTPTPGEFSESDLLEADHVMFSGETAWRDDDEHDHCRGTSNETQDASRIHRDGLHSASVNRGAKSRLQPAASSSAASATSTTSKWSAPLSAPFEYVDRFKATPRIQPRQTLSPEFIQTVVLKSVIATRVFPESSFLLPRGTGHDSCGSENV